jgi:hypothetical protein
MYISSLCYYFFLNLLWIKKKSNHEKLYSIQFAISIIILLVVFITSYSVTGQTFTGVTYLLWLLLLIMILAQTCRLKL